MDRRRFEDAHLKYAALKIVSWYPSMFQLEDLDLSTSINSLLSSVTASYYCTFTRKYSCKKTLTAKPRINLNLNAYYLHTSVYITSINYARGKTIVVCPHQSVSAINLSEGVKNHQFCFLILVTQSATI